HALPAGAVEDSLELISEAIGGIFQAAFQGVKLQGVENISQDDLRQIYRNIVEESGVIAERLTEIEAEFDEALAKLDTVDFPNQSLPEFIEGVIGNAAASRDDLEFAFNAILQFDSAHGSAEAFPGELELEFRVISDTEGEAVAPGGLPLGEHLLIAVSACAER